MFNLERSGVYVAFFSGVGVGGEGTGGGGMGGGAGGIEGSLGLRERVTTRVTTIARVTAVANMTAAQIHILRRDLRLGSEGMKFSSSKRPPEAEGIFVRLDGRTIKGSPNTSYRL